MANASREFNFGEAYLFPTQGDRISCDLGPLPPDVDLGRQNGHALNSLRARYEELRRQEFIIGTGGPKSFRAKLVGILTDPGRIIFQRLSNNRKRDGQSLPFVAPIDGIKDRRIKVSLPPPPNASRLKIAVINSGTISYTTGELSKQTIEIVPN